MNDFRRGLVAGLSAYSIWAVFPLLIALLAPAGTLEILAHRAWWSLIVCALVLIVSRRWRALLAVLRNRRHLIILGSASVLIAVNWGVMVYAVAISQVSQSSLGYYLNPIVTVSFGVIVFREKLRLGQWVAVGIACLAIILITIEMGHLPWISLVLAVSFSAYSALKKALGTAVDALTGLTVETLVLAPLALLYLVMLHRAGEGTFRHFGWPHDLWLISSGIWTAGALIIFAVAAARLPLYLTGMLQYIAPTGHFLLALTYFGDRFSLTQWLGFGLIWLALAVLTIEGLWARQGELKAAIHQRRGKAQQRLFHRRVG